MSTALKSAKKDFLTKYFTRESLAPFINESIKKAQEQKREFGIVLVDLDHFKRFNDKYGHDIGDEVLEYAASTLRITLKGECHFFRYGGDEFILVFDKSRLWEIFNFMKICRFQYGIRHFLHGMKHFRVTFSCGIASFPRDGKTAAALIKRAD